MAFFKTILKTVLSQDDIHIKRYEQSLHVRGALIELGNKDSYKCYLLSRYANQRLIDRETDLSSALAQNEFELEIDTLKKIKNLYIGSGRSDSPYLNSLRNAIISKEKFDLHFKRYPLYTYSSSIEVYDDIKGRIKQMLEGMSDSKLAKGSSGYIPHSQFREYAFATCPKCTQKINVDRFKTIQVVCPNCSNSWTTKIL
jgi:hypothetical protein